MSIEIMTKVFKDTELDSTKKLIMLSLSDNSNDEGYCYPSIRNICFKTSLSNRTVINHLRELEKKNKIISKKRNSKKGGRLSTIYVIYPLENLEKLDENLKEKFIQKQSQSEEATPPPQSEAPSPRLGSQSEAPSPKPSLSLYNHHIYKQLTKEEKELFKEYLDLRKTMKIKTTLRIQDRLLDKYIEFGRDKQIIENAINANWKDFYAPNQNKKEKTSSNWENYQELGAI